MSGISNSGAILVTGGSRGWESESFNSRIKKATPMGRWGEPEDIGRAVAFLINPENTFITGHTLVVDGGIGI